MESSHRMKREGTEWINNNRSLDNSEHEHTGINAESNVIIRG